MNNTAPVTPNQFSERDGVIRDDDFDALIDSVMGNLDDEGVALDDDFDGSGKQRRSRHFCGTANNPSETVYEALRSAVGTRVTRSNVVTYVIFEREVGSQTGTTHLQIYIQCRATCRLQDVIRTFSGIHWTICDGSDEQNYDYCTKDAVAAHGSVAAGIANDVVFEAGHREPIPARKRAGRGARTDWHDLYTQIEEGVRDENYSILDELEKKHFSLFVRYGSAIRDFHFRLTQSTAQRAMSSTLSKTTLWPWQADCMQLIEQELASPAPTRFIHWWHEPTGGIGKSHLANLLASKHNALLLEAGRKMDLTYTFSQALSATGSVPIVVCDFVRTTQPTEALLTSGNVMSGVYSFLESCKNGRMLITKYQSRTIFFKPPVVICFSNWEPDRDSMSHDRWKVVRVVHDPFNVRMSTQA
jgi:hypothetical protein